MVARASSGKGGKSVAGRPPSQRQLRIGETIRHSLAARLSRGGFDEKILNKSIISVTEVRIGPDLKNATAYVMPLGGKDLEKIVTLLNTHSAVFRREIGRDLSLKYTPAITFKADNSFDAAAAIDKILMSDAVQRDVKKDRSDFED
ncbi:30S ribosome-binding factor RbfA [Alphaproteobacteria bacterium]|nr:30S ribosome-binding factor RbfA [Alphaproteobacteria bacterium]